MQTAQELSPSEFRLAHPDTCFACHCRLEAYRYEEDGIVTCSAACATTVAKRGQPARTSPPVPWATDDDEALLT
jgi:hypothetical protein